MSREHEPRSIHLTFGQVAADAKELLLAQGSHRPTLVLEGEREPVGVELHPTPDTHNERLIQMYLTGFSVAQTQIVGALEQVYFISEAWMSSGGEGHDPILPPSEDPQRREILLVTGLQMADRQMRVAVVEMLRDPAGVLRELRELAPADHPDERIDSPLLKAFAQGYDTGLVLSDRDHNL